jgi:hypothetical protein
MPTCIPVSEDPLFTFAEVATATSLHEYSLRNGSVFPDHFGTPAHWKLNRHSVPCLTMRGARELADSLQSNGNPVAAHSLRTLVLQFQQTPSRNLILPGPKSVPVETQPTHAWQKRVDCQ